MTRGSAAERSSFCRLGIDPIENVHLMENHDQAYHVWHAAGFKDRVLVHVDAHHDMWWTDDDRHITIANFICAALKKDIVREMYWVVPDGAFDSAAAKKALVRQVEMVVKSYKADRRVIDVASRSITASIIGKRLTACAFDTFRSVDEAVVLDVDVDYLIIPRVAHNRPDDHAELPWCWPNELVERIRGASLSADLVTIAYSVEGCYTTLPWKYFGDELAIRFSRPHDAGAHGGFDFLRSGAAAEHRRDFAGAERMYLQAATLLPQSAAPRYHLALLAARTERVEEAQRRCRQALQLDASYATGFNTLGPQYFWEKQYVRADAEFRSALLLNPSDGRACVGMAQLAAQRKDWASAIVWFGKALQSSDEILDAHRGLGKAYACTGDLDQAAKHYERSLQLALHGHKPLSWHIATATRSDVLVDEDHGLSYAELGRIYARRGQIKKAIPCYQIALAAGAAGVRRRLRLARLFVRAHRWREAGSQFGLAAGEVPGRARFHAHRAWRKLANLLRGWAENLLDERASGTLES
jgi:tetratricopeptide (TPR) repeat protein